MKTQDIIDKFKHTFPEVKKWKRSCKFKLPSGRILRIFLDAKHDPQEDDSDAILVTLEKDGEVELHDWNNDSMHRLNELLRSKVTAQTDIQTVRAEFFKIINLQKELFEDGAINSVYRYAYFDDAVDKSFAEDINKFFKMKPLEEDIYENELSIFPEDAGEVMGDSVWRIMINKFSENENWFFEVVDD